MTPTVRAHRLEAEHRFLADGRIQIESWFDIGGDSPRGATVEIYGSEGTLLAEGRLNEQGIFVFACPRPEQLRVIVSAGAGHRKEFLISKWDFVRNRVAQAGAGLTPGSVDLLNLFVVQLVANPSPADVPPIPRADRTSRIPWWNVLAGVGLLAAVALIASARLRLKRARQRVHS
jgi:hypothetical protein